MTAGSIGLLLVACVHTLAHFAPPPDDPEFLAAIETMEATRVDAGFGTRPSLADMQRALSLTMSLLLAALACSNLVVLGNASTTLAAVRSLAIVNFLAMAALVALYLFYTLPPPMIFFAALALVFLAASIWPAPRSVAMEAGSAAAG